MSEIVRMGDPLPLDPNARQVGGSHYSGSAYQHWDYATDLKMCHLEGAATKYLARAGNKSGEPRVKDLEKVEHYLEKLTAVFDQRRLKSLWERQGDNFASEAIVARFIAASMSNHAFTPRSVAALVLLSRWRSVENLLDALRYVRDELLEERKKPMSAGDPLKSERAARG
jgi:hypothetical protein